MQFLQILRAREKCDKCPGVGQVPVARHASAELTTLEDKHKLEPCIIDEATDFHPALASVANSPRMSCTHTSDRPTPVFVKSASFFVGSAR